MIKLLTIVLEADSVGEKIDLIKTIDKVIETKKELELEDQNAKFDELLYTFPSVSASSILSSICFPQ